MNLIDPEGFLVKSVESQSKAYQETKNKDEESPSVLSFSKFED